LGSVGLQPSFDTDDDSE